MLRSPAHPNKESTAQWGNMQACQQQSDKIGLVC